MIEMSDDVFIGQITNARKSNNLCLGLTITCQIIRENAKNITNFTVAIIGTYWHLLLKSTYHKSLSMNIFARYTPNFFEYSQKQSFLCNFYVISQPLYVLSKRSYVVANSLHGTLI